MTWVCLQIQSTQENNPELDLTLILFKIAISINETLLRLSVGIEDVEDLASGIRINVRQDLTSITTYQHSSLI